MAIGRDFVLDALLRFNYFPNQRKDRGEVPPYFSSRKFSPKIAKKIASSLQRKPGSGWDAISYRSTRFNGVPRILSIPHPLAHAHLSLSIADNWKELTYVLTSTWSKIRPRQHSDGRLLVMDYESGLEQSKRQHSLAFGRRFRVHTDISGCFSSIYTHSIPWATVGFATAKNSKFDKLAWFNQLDEKARWCKRNETNGLAIGPATSNILVEAILARVDEKIAMQKFTFVRYIDDYTAYCDTESRAQDFIHLLGVELDRYKLLLNIKKTRIDALPQSISASWVSHLNLLLPKRAKLNVYDVTNFLSTAQSLAKAEPDGSVIKYAVKTLISSKLTPSAKDFLLEDMLMLAFHYPTVVPLLRVPIRDALSSASRFLMNLEERLNVLLEHHASHHRSDSTAWLIFFLAKLNLKIKTESCKAIVEAKDCFSMLCLYKAGDATQQSLVVKFAENLNKADFYELDSYWLLLYELFVDGMIGNAYGNKEKAFDVMKAAKITFFFNSKAL